MSRVLAIIPARGGSKGIPRKNLQLVGGLTLLERAVRAAKESEVIDKIIVTTDDEEIAGHAKACGAWVPFLRPTKLSTDDSEMIQVVLHTVDTIEKLYQEFYDIIVLLEPTVPFRKASHIADSVCLYKDESVKSVVTVCPLERKPQNILRINDEFRVSRYIEKPFETFMRRQDMNDLRRISSGAYVIGRDSLMEDKKLVVEPIGFIDMSNIESINIDEEIDLELARLVSNKLSM